MKLKNLLKAIGFCLLLALPLSASASSQEAEYMITESELTLLDTRLEQLASSNIKLARDCRALKAELAKSQAALNEARLQTERLQAELTALKQQSSSNELLLQTANDSLELYAKEVKKQQRIIKRHYTLAGILLGGIVVALSK